jgi:hypothetical protein
MQIEPFLPAQPVYFEQLLAYFTSKQERVHHIYRRPLSGDVGQTNPSQSLYLLFWPVIPAGNLLLSLP